MKNESDNNNQPEEPVKRHYSEKGGHWLRGLHQRVARAIEHDFPNLSPRSVFMQLQPIAMETDWARRRYMRRIPRDGR